MLRLMACALVQYTGGRRSEDDAGSTVRETERIGLDLVWLNLYVEAKIVGEDELSDEGRGRAHVGRVHERKGCKIGAIYSSGSRHMGHGETGNEDA